MGGNWDYGSYRGRKTVRDVLKLVAILLAALLVLAVAALVVGQDYIVYTDKGPRLDLPFFSQPEETPPEPAPDFTVEVQQPELEPEPEPEPVHTLIAVPLTAALDGSAAALAREVGANGVILDMKDDLGFLYWPVDDPMAAAQGLDGQGLESDAALRALTESGLYTVARLSCFKDHGLARNESYAIRTNSGYRWTDPEGVRWTSPTSAEVRDYLVARMVELARLGFDEVLLDNCGYPNRGNLGYIRPGAGYDRNQLSAVIEDFLRQAQEALEPYDTHLSLRCGQEVLTGADTRSGLTAAALERYAHRIWLPATGQEDWQALLAQAGITGETRRVLAVADALPPEAPDLARAALPLPSF